jgi:16S rRNA (uracil1498-N3)-methyltransferase
MTRDPAGRLPACRLFVEPATLAPGPMIVTAADHRYLFRVRRLRAGDPVTLFDGAGREAEAVVQSVSADQAVLSVDAPRPVQPAPHCRVIVLQALIKGERMDWCIQKLVELGVDAIVPVDTERTVVKLAGERARKRRARFVDIARDAARQSRRARIPEVHDIASLDHALAEAADCALKLVLWVGESGRGLRSALPDQPPASVCLLVGPEGGFTEDEIERATRAGFMTVGLGPYILRAETAALSATAIVAAAFGQLGG